MLATISIMAGSASGVLHMSAGGMRPRLHGPWVFRQPGPFHNTTTNELEPLCVATQCGINLTLPWRPEDLTHATVAENLRQYAPLLTKLHAGQPITMLAYGSSVTQDQSGCFHTGPVGGLAAKVGAKGPPAWLPLYRVRASALERVTGTMRSTRLRNCQANPVQQHLRVMAAAGGGRAQHGLSVPGQRPGMVRRDRVCRSGTPLLLTAPSYISIGPLRCPRNARSDRPELPSLAALPWVLWCRAAAFMQVINSSFPHPDHTYVNAGRAATVLYQFATLGCLEEHLPATLDLLVLENVGGWCAGAEVSPWQVCQRSHRAERQQRMEKQRRACCPSPSPPLGVGRRSSSSGASSTFTRPASPCGRPS